MKISSWRIKFNTYSTLIIFSAAILLASGPVFAEEPNGGPGGPHKGPFGKNQERWAEFKKQADTNGDGEVSVEEKKAAKEQWREKREARREEFKKKIDTNGDGTVSDDEKKAAREQWQEKKQERREEFKKKIDTDANGEISKEEKQAARQQWKENHPGKGGPGGPQRDKRGWWGKKK